MSIMGKRQGNGNGNERMPRAPGMPPAPQPPAPAQPRAPALQPHYDEEVLRVAQRDYENKRMIAELTGERDDWRRKCLTVEEDNRRLESRMDREEQVHAAEISKLTAERDNRIEELTQQRDQYKVRLARFETKIVMIGESLIKLAGTTSDTVTKLLEEIRAEQGRPEKSDAAALAAVANAITGEDQAGGAT